MVIAVINQDEMANQCKELAALGVMVKLNTLSSQLIYR
jgi:hypothetical protein